MLVPWRWRARFFFLARPLAIEIARGEAERPEHDAKLLTDQELNTGDGIFGRRHVVEEAAYGVGFSKILFRVGISINCPDPAGLRALGHNSSPRGG